MSAIGTKQTWTSAAHMLAFSHATVIIGSEQIAVHRLLAVSLPIKIHADRWNEGGTNIPMDI
jgi:hypothetical protein